MRRRLQACFLDNALDRGVGALAGRTARAIGDRDECRRQRLQPANAGPQIGFGFIRPGRREFERDRQGTGIGDQLFKAHAASFLLLALAVANHSLTVSFSLWLRGAMVSLPALLKPAAANQLSTSLSEKPRRRWAYSSRRNSSLCGAKSAISNRAPGAITRAASATAAPGSSR